MLCSRCQNVNPSDARFCTECGYALPRCRNCATPVATAYKFCPACGTPLVMAATAGWEADLSAVMSAPEAASVLENLVLPVAFGIPSTAPVEAPPAARPETPPVEE